MYKTKLITLTMVDDDGDDDDVLTSISSFSWNPACGHKMTGSDWLRRRLRRWFCSFRTH